MAHQEAAPAPQEGGAAREPGAETQPAWRRNLLAFGHLAVLSAFALAQPLFDLLSDNPEFFAARGSTASEIIVFAVLLVLVPPALLLAVEVLAGLAGERVRAIVHVVFIGLLAAVVFVQALKKALEVSDALLIALALGLGALAALAYARAEAVRSFLSVLTPAPLVFLALFLFISPVSKLTLSGEASAKTVDGVKRVPVVMIVYDEFPTNSLLDGEGEIDARRYPGFAALARDSTWFRNAHTIYDSTSKAVPAIMDGHLPEKGTLPTSSEHPDSIFALLGKSHRMNVSEEATSVCPRDLCEDARLDEPFVDRLTSMTEDLGLVYAHVVSPPGIEDDLASVSETWGEFGGDTGGAQAATADAGDRPNTRENLQGNRNNRFDAWIDSIRAGRPALNFKHALLPHVPWQYLPDGRQYRRTATEPIPGISRQSYRDQGQVDQLQLRHLLQVGFADLELRKTIRRLKQLGIYDDALIVVTADHGVSFKQGQFDRRNVNRGNIDEITPVPLFVKEPEQSRGRVNDAIVETTDIAPTVADLLGIERPEGVDGRSAFSDAVRRRREVRMLKRDLSGYVRVSGQELEREVAAEVAETARLFGTGADEADRIYRIGPNPELVGRPATSAGRSDARATIADGGELADVNLRSATVPAWVTGRVSGGAGPPKQVAVAVNGTVRAVGNTFRLATGGGELFGMMVPPSSFRQGANRVQVFEVSGGRLLSMN